MTGFFCGLYSLACLVRVRAQASKRIQTTKETVSNIVKDDSGSKLRDKEQQRLSSK